MPDPRTYPWTDEQIEKVALAISTAIEKHRPTHDESRAMARAAIAAMPQPIGYGVVIRDNGGWGIGSASQALRETLDDAADFRQDCENVTVVALVPVEVQP